MNEFDELIRQRISDSRSVLVASHIRPDGDAIGSSLAFSLALVDLGKQVQVVLPNAVPENFAFLPGVDLVVTKASGEFDLIAVLDCSDLKRIGNALLGYRVPDLTIDHHVTNDAFGLLNVIEPEAAATASVLIRHMHSWGLKISPPMATNLMTGLVTDTLGFRTSNTTSETLRQAADLMDLGADLDDLYYRSLVRRTFMEAKYWGLGLSSLEKSDGIVWATLSIKDRQASGYSGNDDSDLINIVSSIDEAYIAIMFVEQDEMRTKVSWRGLKPWIDVAKISCQFNGGGHKAASGADITGSLEESRTVVITATRLELDEQLKLFSQGKSGGNDNGK
jgi:phosphoesterase RecJ-like protein